MEESQDRLELSLIDSVARSNLGSLAEDAAEITLDAVLEEGLLRDIPIFSTITKLAGIVHSIRQQLFAKKVYRFLAELGEIPDKQRERFVADMGDERKRQQVGETIILLLDRLDNMENGLPPFSGPFRVRGLQALVRGQPPPAPQTRRVSGSPASYVVAAHYTPDATPR